MTIIYQSNEYPTKCPEYPCRRELHNRVGLAWHLAKEHSEFKDILGGENGIDQGISRCNKCYAKVEKSAKRCDECYSNPQERRDYDFMDKPRP